MAEEQAEGAEGTEGKDGKEGGKPKKKLSLVQLAFVGQLLVLLGAAGIIAKVTMFTKRPDLRESTLRERAIASIEDPIESLKNLSLSEFTVNLPKDHILKAKLELEISNQKTADLLDRRMSAVRARVLNVLSKQSLESTNSLQGKLKLKDTIREAINEELFKNGEKKGVVREVYFVEFMLL